MRHFISLGPTPREEPCAQVGEPDYRRKALAECQRFIALLREIFGPEPEGPELQTKSFPHDFGTYYEVVCYDDPDRPSSIDHAFRLEHETPPTWGDNAETAATLLSYLWASIIAGDGRAHLCNAVRRSVPLSSLQDAPHA